MTNEQIIRDACISTNPDKKDHRNLTCQDICTNGIDTYHDWNEREGRGCVENKAMEIGLADVLLAIQNVPKSSKLVIDDYGVFWDFNTLSNSTLQRKPFAWNLRTDSLEAQSEETKQFLADILAK